MLIQFSYFCRMYFRKHISGLLACLLLISNSGFAFSVHYCGGQIAGITSAFNKSEICEMPLVQDKACCAAFTDDHKACCEDKVVDLEKSQDVVIKNFAFSIGSPFIAPSLQPDNIVNAAVDFIPAVKLNYYHQPHSPPLFRLYHQFIFYA